MKKWQRTDTKQLMIREFQQQFITNQIYRLEQQLMVATKYKI